MWKIRKDWIRSEYYPIKQEYWKTINYWREWNGKLWRKRIAIKTDSNNHKTYKMLMAAFHEENNKKSFKGLKSYHVFESGEWKAIVLAKKLTCAECGKEINEKEINFFEEMGMFCPQCNELKRQINKLKE